jgi:zinc/manganese transport system ATP-binding protein
MSNQSTPAPHTAIRFDDVTLGYDRHPAVHHLTGLIAQGEMLAVLGPNGSGKSTLLKGISGVIRPLDGQIHLGAPVAYLPQSADIDRSFPITVFDLVAMGLIPSRGLMGRMGRKDNARIIQALAKVGLVGFEDRAIGTLSGGQMQRVLFARLILQDAPILLLDEPFTAVDETTQTDLIALLQDWHKQGRTVVAVLHDLTLIRQYFPRSLLLAREVIDWGQTEDVLTPDTLTRARHMAEAHDPFAAACERAA